MIHRLDELLLLLMPIVAGIWAFCVSRRFQRLRSATPTTTPRAASSVMSNKVTSRLPTEGARTIRPQSQRNSEKDSYY